MTGRRFLGHSTVEEADLQNAMGIGVFHRGKLADDLDLEARFFPAFANGRLFGRFVGCDFAAREFAESGQRNARRPCAYQETVALLHDGDCDRFRRGQGFDTRAEGP